MKLSHCHVDVTATAVGVASGPLQTFMVEIFVKKDPPEMFERVINMSTVTNEKPLTNIKQIAHISDAEENYSIKS